MSSTKPSNDFFKYIDIDAIDNKLHIVKAPKQIATKDAPSRASRYLEFGDTLFSMVRPYLENIAYISDELKDCIASTGFYVCSPYRNLNSEFIYHLMLSKYVISGLNSFMKGDNSPSINASDIEDFLYPIPPINEQQRITQTIKELLSLVETLANDKVNLSELIKKTKAKVLDLAIKGMLVPQDPNDEPADKLLEKIREEKEKLIKEGKLKRDKNETYIFKNSDDNSYYEQIDGKTICIDDDLPFEIPDTWRWCRLKEIINIVNGFTPLRSNPNFWNSNDIPWFTVDDIREQGRFIQKTRQHISNSAISKNSNRIVPENTVLLCCTASVGEYALTKIPLTTNQQFNGLVIKNECKEILNYLYLYEFVKTLKNMLILESGATTFNFLSVSALGEFLIPIPPYKEQLLIAKNLENIFSYLDNLETIIKGS